MNIVIPIVFHILAILFFVFAIYEEKEEKYTDDEQRSSDNIVVLLLMFTTIFFFVGGASMMGVTESYYSGITDTVMETAPLVAYQPIGWFGVAFGFFSGFLVINKVFDILGSFYEKDIEQQ